MISHRHKFIFIHVHKTGGNSIQRALSEYSEDKLVSRQSVGVSGEGLQVFNQDLFGDRDCKHFKLQDYYEALGEGISDYFIFTSIRHPLDRLVSFNRFFGNDNITVDNVLTPEPFVNFVTINGKIRVDDFIIFEQLEYDFGRICSRLGLDCKLDGGKGNELPVLSDSVEAKVSHLYVEDFKLYKCMSLS
jgi:hypothetical protein